MSTAKKEQTTTPTTEDFLPWDQIYTIQIGQQSFKLNGSSLNSDGPNFFTRYFQTHTMVENNSLFIDRDPEIFHTITKHLQGYFIDIKDEYEYTMLFTDSIYYGFPRLRQLFKDSEYYFANVGGKSFKIPKSLFRREGDSLNYFQIILNSFYKEVEQRIVEKNLVKTPLPPSYVPRSAEFFQDLLTLLSGTSLELSDEKRESLAEECRYYRFLNLEQKLTKSSIIYNPLSTLEEIVIPLKDLKRRGLRFHSNSNSSNQHTSSSSLNRCLDTVGNRANCNGGIKSKPSSTDVSSNSSASSSSSSSSCSNNSSDNEREEPASKKLKKENMGGVQENCTTKKHSNKNKAWSIVTYKKPYVDKYSRDLIFQIDSTECMLMFNKKNKMIHVDLIGRNFETFESIFTSPLFQNSNEEIDLSKFKIQLPSSDTTTSKSSKENPSVRQTQSNNGTLNSAASHLILPACISICDLYVNGVKCPNICSLINDTKYNENIIHREKDDSITYAPGINLYLTKSLWKLGVKDGKIMLIAIKAEAFSGIKEYNKLIQFI
ncbi:uncharacterized protein NDAI_0G02740 [Naumovozyma dairenensis CBS 421]|uniref:BTB domain-containing protein n=1 Tax=Naumovozyma dairenensis (strain ATCC 10597 / BCRC 20456 / CBS 421 / NBRC 0211 / NRRL Y-12639) TaxID=1071378 RepID=G0WE40_NAUDC|nr:hypothetical protein NDAI_0G02740 [Naumovozyma dairenensis CBS 421]CCD26051.2 hypothetical protein NDAI_0G02740 [Naumovozyma dairenensis CBS 421]